MKVIGDDCLQVVNVWGCSLLTVEVGMRLFDECGLSDTLPLKSVHAFIKSSAAVIALMMKR